MFLNHHAFKAQEHKNFLETSRAQSQEINFLARLVERNPYLQDFELCPGYIFQANREGCYCLKNRTSIVFFTFRYTDQKQLVVTTSFGQEKFSLIADLINKWNGPIICKNVSLSEIMAFKAIGFECYSHSEQWDEFSKFDDNSYPEQIIETNKTSSLEGRHYSSLREELRRSERKYEVHLSTYQPAKHIRVFMKLLERWAEQMKARNGGQKYDYIGSHVLFGWKSPFLDSFLIRDEKDNPIGFLTFSKISATTLGFNALINDFSYAHSYRRLMYLGINYAAESGYQYINIQGSEDRDQYFSKRRFKADIELRKIHMKFRTQ